MEQTQLPSYRSKSFSLFYQLFFSIVVLAILPLLIVIIGEYQKGKKSILDHQYEQLKVMNHQIDEELENYLKSIATSINIQSSMMELMLLHINDSYQAHDKNYALLFKSINYELIVEQYQQELKKLIDTHQLPGIMLVNDQGRILYASGVDHLLLGEDILGTTFDSTILASSFQKSLIDKETKLTYPEKINSINTIAYTRLIVPVFNEYKVVKGFVIVAINTQQLLNYFKFFNDNLSIGAFLLTERGVIQYGTDIAEKQIMQKYISSIDEINQQFLQRESILEYKNHKNELVVADLHRVSLYGLPSLISVEVLKTVALAPINSFRSRLIVLIMITLVIVSLVAYIITKKIVNPMQNLTKRIIKVKNGDYEPHELLQGYKEINLLSYNFEYMTSELKRLWDERTLQIWHQNGLVQLDNIIRKNSSLQELSDNIITFLIRYLDFKVGAIYIVKDKQLDLFSTYARMKSDLKQFYAFGEDIVGQVAVNQKILEIKDNSNSSLLIESATGTVTPGSVVAIPITLNQETLAVIVLAQFYSLTKTQSNFIKHCENNIAMAIRALLKKSSN